MLMQSAIVSQLAKARRYIEEPELFVIVDAHTVRVHGLTNEHVLHRQLDDSWRCDCSFSRLGVCTCCHIRALEQLLDRGILCLSQPTAVLEICMAQPSYSF